MRKLCLTLCLVFVFLSLFSVSVFATDIDVTDSLSLTDSLFPLQVGDVLPPGIYVFNDVVDFDRFVDWYESDVYTISASFSCDGYSCTSIYFTRLSDKSGYSFSFRPDIGTVYRSYPSDGIESGWVSDSYRYITINEPVTVNNFNSFFFNNLTEYRHTDRAVDILDVFDEVFDGFLALFESFVFIFFVDGSLTFLGVLSVVALAISISLLFFYVFLRFLKFRG